MFKILATDGCTLQETCATQPLCHQGRKPVWLQCRENFIPYIPIHMYSPEGSCFSGYRINIFDSEGACTVEQLSETQIKRVESSCQISMESQGIKQVQRLLQKILEEKSKEKSFDSEPHCLHSYECFNVTGHLQM